MKRFTTLQLIGPSILFVAALAAEISAYALAHAPSSGLLWYINLNIFGVFQQAYYILGSRTGIPAFNFFFVVLPIFALGCLGIAGRRRLLLAISSNFSFVYAGLLFYSWTHTHLLGAARLQASLIAMSVPTRPDFCLVGVLVGSSLLSCCISHFLYMRTVYPGR